MTVTSLMLVFWSSSSSRHIAAANIKNSVCTLQRTLENFQTNEQTNISFVINLLTRASWQCSLKVLVELHQVWSYWIVCGEERIALSYVHLFLVWSIWNKTCKSFERYRINWTFLQFKLRMIYPAIHLSRVHETRMDIHSVIQSFQIPVVNIWWWQFYEHLMVTVLILHLQVKRNLT
jgi:hypothetical protein